MVIEYDDRMIFSSTPIIINGVETYFVTKNLDLGNMKIKLIIISFTIFISSCQTQRDNTLNAEEKSLLQTIQFFNNSFSKYDVDALRDLTTSNYRHVNGANPPISKPDWLKYLNSRREKMEVGNLTIDKYSFLDPSVDLNGNSAFVTGLVEVEGSEDGVSFVSRLRVSMYWIKIGGTWKRAGFHDSRIAD